MLQGRYGEVRDAAEDALEAAEAAGCEHLRGPVFNRLGLSLFALGEEEEGRHAFEKAIEISRDKGSPTELSRRRCRTSPTRCSAPAAAARGSRSRSRATRPPRRARARSAGCRCSAARSSSRSASGTRPRSHCPATARATGTTLANFNLCWAALHLGRGDDDRARPLLESTERLLVLSLEPQFLARCGQAARRAGAPRRRPRRPPARRSTTRSTGSSSAARTASGWPTSPCAGVVVEADAAERAADVGDPEAAQARAPAGRDAARPRAGRGGGHRPRGRRGAHAATATAEFARADGNPDPALWAAAAEAVDRARASLPGRAGALARGGGAPARRRPRRDRRRRPRGGGRSPSGSARAGCCAEVEGLAARARLRLEETPADAARRAARGRGPVRPHRHASARCSSLLAGGATNRQIGAQLFMAEKTASVHVSRILAKLDVRSRTEAAAVAHRHGLEV